MASTYRDGHANGHPDSHGLADDYYDGSPAPSHRRRHSFLEDRLGDRLQRSRSRARLVFDTLESGGSIHDALDVMRSREPAMPPRRHGHGDEPTYSDQDDDDDDDYRPHHGHHRGRGRRRYRDSGYGYYDYDTDRDHDGGGHDDYHDGDHDHRRARTTTRRPARSPARTASRRSHSTSQLQQALRTAAIAGAVEALRQHGQPGRWTREKGTRVATAALSASAIDVGLSTHDRDRHAGRNAVVSTLGGIMVNRLAQGSR